MAIEAVEVDAAREQNAKLATPATFSLRPRVSLVPSPPANQNGEARRPLATLWASIFRRAGDGIQDHREAPSGGVNVVILG
jgi:hypothetical protein